MQELGPDGNALETQAISEQSVCSVHSNAQQHLSQVARDLVTELHSGEAAEAPAAAADAGGTAEDTAEAVVSLEADGTDNPS